LSAIFYILDIFPGTALYQDYKERFKLSDDIWLNRVEDIMYFETDAVLSRDLILAFGHKLRTFFYSQLPEFVEALDLVDRKDLYPQHSDFFSRLALTFDKGDYAGIDAIPNKKKIAERLYRHSLEYGPHARAYLGLGIIEQKKGAFEKSIRILSEGLEIFPEDEHLHICLAVSYMNMGKFEVALSHLLKFEYRKEALHAIASCYQALNHSRKAADYFKRFETLNKQHPDS
jgi:tetratricopeptide (TPR) repeat protein